MLLKAVRAHKNIGQDGFLMYEPQFENQFECIKLIDACSYGKKAMTNLDRVLKIRHITLPTKIHIIKAMVFPVVVYECESLTMKKAEVLKN